VQETRIETCFISDEQFGDGAMGTKINVDKETYLKALVPFIENVNFNKIVDNDTVEVTEPGQALIAINNGDLKGMVSPGDGPTKDLGMDAYHIREHRGKVGTYLKREHAGKCENLAVVVYTAEKFGKDKVPEGTTHVLVTTLASACPTGSAYNSHRFVSNFAGDNDEFNILKRLDDHMRKFGEETGTYRDSKNGYAQQVEFLVTEIQRLKKVAKETTVYETTYSVVADEVNP